jgi:hypothetical protein
MVGQIAAQEVEMRCSPVGNQVIVVAIADRAADNQKQHFRQRMRHPPWLARVFDRREMLQKRLQAWLLKSFKGGKGHGRLRTMGAPWNQINRNP